MIKHHVVEENVKSHLKNGEYENWSNFVQPCQDSDCERNRIHPLKAKLMAIPGAVAAVIAI